jgi:hypothetical protein
MLAESASVTAFVVFCGFAAGGGFATRTPPAVAGLGAAGWRPAVAGLGAAGWRPAVAGLGAAGWLRTGGGFATPQRWLAWVARLAP